MDGRVNLSSASSSQILADLFMYDTVNMLTISDGRKALSSLILNLSINDCKCNLSQSVNRLRQVAKRSYLKTLRSLLNGLVKGERSL